MFYPILPGTYTCTKCKAQKPYTEFHKDSRNKTGLCSWCKECSRAAARRAQLRKQEIGSYEGADEKDKSPKKD